MRDVLIYAKVFCDMDKIVEAMAKRFENYVEDSSSWLWDDGDVRVHVMDNAWHSYNKSFDLDELLKWADENVKE